MSGRGRPFKYGKKTVVCSITIPEDLREFADRNRISLSELMTMTLEAMAKGDDGESILLRKKSVVLYDMANHTSAFEKDKNTLAEIEASIAILETAKHDRRDD